MIDGKDAFGHALEDYRATFGFEAEAVYKVVNAGSHAVKGQVEDRGFLAFIGQRGVEVVGIEDVFGEGSEAFDAPRERPDEDPGHDRGAANGEEDFQDDAGRPAAATREIDGDDDQREEGETAQKQSEPDRRGHTGKRLVYMGIVTVRITGGYGEVVGWLADLPVW
jgi:hypothetical protein